MKQFAKLTTGAPGAQLGGGERPAELCRDLRETPALEVLERQERAVVGRELREHGFHLVGGRARRGICRRVDRVRHGPFFVLTRGLGLPPATHRLPAKVIAADIGRDPQQPVGERLLGSPVRQTTDHAEKRVLHEVVEIGARTGETPEQPADRRVMTLNEQFHRRAITRGCASGERVVVAAAGGRAIRCRDIVGITEEFWFQARPGQRRRRRAIGIRLFAASDGRSMVYRFNARPRGAFPKKFRKYGNRPATGSLKDEPLRKIMKLSRILASVTIALVSSVAALAADPSGTWKFKAEGPNGRAVDSTLTLKWDNQQLTGTIENRAGKAEIRNAKFVNDQVSFTVTRKIRRRSFTTNYSGKLEGDAIKGTIEATNRKKEKVSLPWEAQRAK